MIRITVNDEEHLFDEETTIQTMLKELGLDDKIVVVVLNDDIVNSENYANTILKDGDKIELVRIVGGG